VVKTEIRVAEGSNREEVNFRGIGNCEMQAINTKTEKEKEDVL
jgi:hypothetical protein